MTVHCIQPSNHDTAVPATAAEESTRTMQLLKIVSRRDAILAQCLPLLKNEPDWQATEKALGTLENSDETSLPEDLVTVATTANVRGLLTSVLNLCVKGAKYEPQLGIMQKRIDALLLAAQKRK